ncbi:MAG: hypothetical protein HPY53_01250 [Brevinematales bacterium]|nr:hypothetical protein [Brevinematales bacterium]
MKLIQIFIIDLVISTAIYMPVFLIMYLGLKIDIIISMAVSYIISIIAVNIKKVLFDKQYKEEINQSYKLMDGDQLNVDNIYFKVFIYFIFVLLTRWMGNLLPGENWSKMINIIYIFDIIFGIVLIPLHWYEHIKSYHLRGVK